jgi:hypothetical protein
MMMITGWPRGRRQGNEVCLGGLANQVAMAGTAPSLGGQLPLMGQGQEQIGQKSQQAKQGLPPRGGQAAWGHDRRIIPLFLSDIKRQKHLSANATELQLFFAALAGPANPGRKAQGGAGSGKGNLYIH